MDERPFSKADYEALATFRYALRSFLRFSEDAARAHGLTPQQHQLLLAIKGLPGRERATIGELAERLKLRPHSVLGEGDRAVSVGLVAREAHPTDGRVVEVVLTALGERTLASLTAAHRKELEAMHEAFEQLKILSVTRPSVDTEDHAIRLAPARVERTPQSR